MKNASKNKGSNSSAEKFKFKGFHNIVFTERDRNEFQQVDETGNVDVYDCMLVLAETGCKCSFSYDGWKDAMVFSVTCKRTGTHLDGYCLTFYHRDGEKAIRMGSWYLRRVLEDESLFIPADTTDLDW